MKKHYLVTGGGGFIGSNIVKMLIKKGNKVSVFDNFQRGKSSRLENISKKIKLYKGDIRDKKLLLKSFKKIDSVIHLAYVNGTKFFYDKPDEIIDIAVRGMLNVIDASLKNKVREFILFSSSEVYSNPSIIPTPESIELKIPDLHNPRYSYGGGKICCELMLRHLCDKQFNRSIIIRPHNVYGPDMGEEHIIPEITKKALLLKKNQKLKTQGSGNETRSFIYIDDFLDGFQKVLNRGKHLEIYNIGTNEELKIKQVIKKILKNLNKNNKLKTGIIRKGSPTRRQPEIKKIKSIGFKQKVSFDKGLLKVLNWYKNYYLS
jgi:nucleoside-diphosphate-sugar epimerase